MLIKPTYLISGRVNLLPLINAIPKNTNVVGAKSPKRLCRSNIKQNSPPATNAKLTLASNRLLVLFQMLWLLLFALFIVNTVLLINAAISVISAIRTRSNANSLFAFNGIWPLLCQVFSSVE